MEPCPRTHRRGRLRHHLTSVAPDGLSATSILVETRPCRLCGGTGIAYLGAGDA